MSVVVNAVQSSYMHDIIIKYADVSYIGHREIEKENANYVKYDTGEQTFMYLVYLMLKRARIVEREREKRKKTVTCHHINLTMVTSNIIICCYNIIFTYHVCYALCTVCYATHILCCVYSYNILYTCDMQTKKQLAMKNINQFMLLLFAKTLHNYKTFISRGCAACNSALHTMRQAT